MQEFVDSLSVKDQAKFKKSHNDYLIGMGTAAPDSVMHKVSEFWQLRWKGYRVLCHLDGNEFLLLHAFRKSTGKTKDTDIKKARGYLQEEEKKQEEGRAK